MLALAFAVALGLTPPPAEAAPSTPLHWSAPAGCPSETDLRRGVEALLGGPIDAPGRAAIDIDGAIVAAGDG